MQLRCSQPFADISLRGQGSLFLLTARKITAPGSTSIRPVTSISSSTETDSCGIHTSTRKAVSILLAAADRRGSQLGRHSRPCGNARVASINDRLHRRTLSTDTVYERPSQILAAKRTRQRKRGRVMAPPGATREKFYFQFITTPTSDTPGTTLLLHFDSKRYLFGNVAEGTQRACTQRAIALKKTRNIFLTGQVNWRNTGGLIGMILTMADGRAAEKESERLRLESLDLSRDGSLRADTSSAKDRLVEEDETLTIHGGDGLLHTMACARHFVFRKSMPVKINEFEYLSEGDSGKPTWADENVRVWAMPIAPSSPTLPVNSLGKYAMPLGSGTNRDEGRRKRSHDAFSGESCTKAESSTTGQHRSDRELKHNIISSMFNSDWNRDALFETPLEGVKMPASLFIRDATTQKITTYDGPRPGDGSALPDIKVLARSPWPGAMIEDLPDVSHLGFKPAVSYIVQGYPQRGRFDPDKARALDVPRGPCYSSLAAGNSVTLEDGRVVTPDMVLDPTKPGRGIAIVDLPSAEYVDNLIARPEWDIEALRAGVTAICWILGSGVASNDKLKEFMASMSQMEHIVSSTDACPNYLALDSCAASAIRLSCISKRHFPVPVHDNVTLPQEYGGRVQGTQCAPQFIPAMRGLTIEVEPQFVIKRDEIAPFLNTALVVQELPHRVQECARLARTKILEIEGAEEGEDAANGSENSSFDPEIITLGTGSSMPSKYRNVSATLLRTEKYGNFLFDCGENTMGQLRRVFDPVTVRDVLKKLKLIWISHLHADHHLGTLSVLAAHRLALLDDGQTEIEADTSSAATPPASILVAGERKMMKFLNEYQSVETFSNIKQLDCSPWQGPMADMKMLHHLREELGISKMQTTGVDHCSGAQAISIIFENGFKFSYSGDCRPSFPFATIGKGSDVLVHEATFDDDMEGDAQAKKHCTTGEALGVAAQMQAKNVILTHFSQRYQKLPVMSSLKLPSSNPPSTSTDTDDLLAAPGAEGEHGDADEDDSASLGRDTGLKGWTPVKASGPDGALSDSLNLGMHIGVAFDYMRVRVSQIKHLDKLRPAFSALFEAEKSTATQDGTTLPTKSNARNRAKESRASKSSKSSGPDAETQKKGSRTRRAERIRRAQENSEGVE